MVQRFLDYEMKVSEFIGFLILIGIPYGLIGLVWSLTHMDHLGDLSGADRIVSGGNFHAEPVAFAADQIALALAEIGAISQRRIALMVDPALNFNLPPFLTPAPGLNSGLMIAEVTTAVANGDLSRKITVDVKGEILELKNTINMMVEQLRTFASEVTRVAKEVGTEGRLGGQAGAARNRGEPGPASVDNLTPRTAPLIRRPPWLAD